LTEAIRAGLFSCPSGCLDNPCDAWRQAQYYRLLHRLGVVNKFQRKYALQADKANVPWGVPPVHAVPAAVPPGLAANPIIPDVFPVISITPAMSAHQVREIGKANAHLVDWQALAVALGAPDLGPTLSDVARHTMFRRMPFGRGMGHLTACRVGGGTVKVLGQHLAEAVVTLVARGEHLLVSRW
jgi:hypothetical protein